MPVNFSITPDTMQNVREVRNASESSGFVQSCSHSGNFSACVQRSTLPKFLVRGHLDATNCVITQPLTGELQVENSDVPIKSVELQLVRVETCGEHLLQEDQKSRCAEFHSPAFHVQVVLKDMPEMPQRSRTSR